MVTRQTGWPFQEGYICVQRREIHIFTDYRWNDGTVSRCWHVDPENAKGIPIDVKPVSLGQA